MRGTPDRQILYLPFLFLQLPLYREASAREERETEIANSAELAPVYKTAALHRIWPHFKWRGVDPMPTAAMPSCPIFLAGFGPCLFPPFLCL